MGQMEAQEGAEEVTSLPALLARRQRLNHSTSRTLAALIGSLPAALLVCIALAAALPLPLEQRYLIGCYSVVPLWLALACWTFLAVSARRAWGRLAVVSSAAALLSVLLLGWH